MMTFCMPIDFVYKCANVCRVSTGQEKLLFLKSQEKVRTI